ncbi:CS1 type fimbrial major subunit [Robbsia andropogonis]|uniref:CS1 type fimbrial major subunit n=1 Tax=Robbsia andropogonis TaxID=28092 RepID=UPI00209FF2AF|nr:CS1 type fimbrial major subunit [Robbsia andropogonis]MCP1117374.1 fimbrial protein [Robbsia andropogonis]MCP1126841.1 fimbrial protein [Robbsia andropogonis]
MKVKTFIGIMAMVTCLPAFAAGSKGTDVPGSLITQQFNITANVDSMLQLTAPDGNALDPNVSMKYSLITNTLSPADVNAILATNAPKNNIVASVPMTPVLFSGTNQIPLTVKMNNTLLKSSETLFKANTLFTNGNTAAIDFNFAPAAPKGIAQGAYKGTVIIDLQQQTPTVTS